MRILLLLILLPLLLVAYSDNDLDGVEDKNDLCPNTSMIEIVDSSGCTIERLVDRKVHNIASYDVIFGMGYSKNSIKQTESQTVSESLQVDYFYKKLSVQLQGSHFDLSSDNHNKSGTSDTYLGAYYRLDFAKKLRMSMGARLNIPTYKSHLNNNNLDYTLSGSFNYRIEKITLLAGLGYTVINDDDINSSTYQISYQNTLNYHMGIGYFLMPNLYLNLSYSNTDSIYKGHSDLKSASFYGHYGIDHHWFSTLSYSKGLNANATDHSTSLRIGYYF